MIINLFIRGLLMGFLMSLPVGPMAVLVIQRTANRNFRSGIYSGLGVAFTDTFWAIIAAFSLSYIITFLRTYQSIIQIIGAIILFLLGFSIFRSHPINAVRKFKRKGTSPWQCFFTAVLVALSNPLVVLAYIGIFASTNLVLSFDNFFDTLLFISGFFIGASSWWLILTSIINFFRHRFNLRILWWFNKVSGALIMLVVIITSIIVFFNGSPSI